MKRVCRLIYMKHCTNLETIQLVDSPHPVPNVDEIQHCKVRITILHHIGGTLVRMTLDAGGIVCRFAAKPSWESEAPTDGKNVYVEVVVDQVELVGREERSLSAVDLAREFGIGGIVRVFPHLSTSMRCWFVRRKEG